MKFVLFVKRTMDILFSIFLIILFLPVMIGISIAVKLTSRGPILYKQARTGALSLMSSDVPIFLVYKFRTMETDAESKTGAVLSTPNDPRTTPIGSFLRRTRLDELPQLFNVLKGDMSLVGPRPERPELMRPLNSSIPFFEERLRFVKPGITGLAQIKLKYDGNIAEDSELAPLVPALVNPFKMEELKDSVADGMRIKLLYDLVYSTSLERFTTFIKTDLSIIFKTPYIMFFNKTGQ